MITLLVDNREIQAEEGASVLQTCLKNDIYIPNLCYMHGMEHPPGSCRLCWVRIEGMPRPVTSCSQPVREGMVITTNTPEVYRLQKTAYKLLMSVHHADAKTCPLKAKCTLVRIARHLKTGHKPRPFDHLDRSLEQEIDLGLFYYYPYRCVLCGRCVYVCEKTNGHALLTFAKRGFDTVISHFSTGGDQDITCKGCGACAAVCPTAALRMKGKETVVAANGA